MKKLWTSDEATRSNQASPKAIRNHNETIELIISCIDWQGRWLDIGSRNVFTERLENQFEVKIDSTYGDLDMDLKCFGTEYDRIHYNNVIEHQFNPLLTLLKIKDLLAPGGYLILGCPLKPRWITQADCHFNEFDLRSYELIIQRAGFTEIARKHYYRKYSIKGIRPFLGSFHERQVISILK